MKCFVVHQNYPGQFKFLSPALATDGHQVIATRLVNAKGHDADLGSTQSLGGVEVYRYATSRSSTLKTHPWALDFETKVIRGQALFDKAKELRSHGFNPDLIVAHPGWGEALFLQQVWPKAKLAIFCEWFYGAQGLDVGFDPEFGPPSDNTLCRLTVKNLSCLSAMQWASGGLAPTHWQANTYPADFRKKMVVVHDGIDTQAIHPATEDLPWPDFLAKAGVPPSVPLVTFINRNLEPYRGYHSFMRALPQMLAGDPQLHVAMVGGEDKGYGAAAPQGKTWRQVYEAEVFGKLTSQQEARVHYLGKLPHDQLVRLYQTSTVHVYLTYPFVLSWSVLEAMSAGCAVVASRTGPVEEVIQDGDNGVLVDFFNPSALVETVLTLVSDPQQRKILGQNARKTIVERYDLKTVCLPKQIEWISSLV